MSDRPPDPDSLRYAQQWEPVLAPAAHRLLDRVARPPATCLDLGAGTGSLTLEAARRWPAARIMGVDASAGMLSVARHRLTRLEDIVDAGRVTLAAADVLDLPLDDATFDLAVSSFVLQLVPDRQALLLEIRRVLRPGGTFAFVTWIAEQLEVSADGSYEEVTAAVRDEDGEAGFRPPRSGDFHSLAEARDGLRAAGFEHVDVQADVLRYRWTPASYLEFKERYDDHELFDALDRPDREALRAAILERWAALPARAFEVRGPLVSALAHTPA